MSEYLGNSGTIHLDPERYVEQSLTNRHGFFPPSFLSFIYYFTVNCSVPQFLYPGWTSEKKKRFCCNPLICYICFWVLIHTCAYTFFSTFLMPPFVTTLKTARHSNRVSRKIFMLTLTTSSTHLIKFQRTQKSKLFASQLTFQIKGNINRYYTTLKWNTFVIGHYMSFLVQQTKKLYTSELKELTMSIRN